MTDDTLLVRLPRRCPECRDPVQYLATEMGEVEGQGYVLVAVLCQCASGHTTRVEQEKARFREWL